MLYRIDSEYALRDIFRACNRDYYTLEAYNYMIEYFDEIDEPDYEVDVIELCGMFSEYSRQDFIEEFVDNADCIAVIEKTDENYLNTGYSSVDEYLDELGYFITDYIADSDDLFNAVVEYIEDDCDFYIVSLDNGDILTMQ